MKTKISDKDNRWILVGDRNQARKLQDIFRKVYADSKNNWQKYINLQAKSFLSIPEE